jgi:DUF438 domain-containing protein
MWALHDDIRIALKSAKAGIKNSQVPDVVNTLRYLSKSVRDMIYKEEHILFPMAKDLLTDAEWRKARQGEEEIGYAWVTPEQGWTGGSGAAPSTESAREGTVRLDTGQMTIEQVNMMLKHMPMDVSFVDENDEVRYYRHEGPYLSPQPRRHRQEGPELPSAQELRHGPEDPRRVPRGQARQG